MVRDAHWQRNGAANPLLTMRKLNVSLYGALNSGAHRTPLLPHGEEPTGSALALTAGVSNHQARCLTPSKQTARLLIANGRLCRPSGFMGAHRLRLNLDASAARLSLAAQPCG